MTKGKILMNLFKNIVVLCNPYGCTIKEKTRDKCIWTIIKNIIMAKGLRINRLIGLAPLMLFLSSYIPLFGIIALRQFLSNIYYLNWAVFSAVGFMSFIIHFKIASLCMAFIIIGSLGMYLTFEGTAANLSPTLPLSIRIAQFSSIFCT